MGAAILFVSVSLGWLAWQAVTIIGPNPACFYHGQPGVVPSDSALCQALRSLINDRMGSERTLNLGLAATTAAFVLGILLGAPVVAREIEQRTAQISWTLTRSRSSWLAHRLIPIALFLVPALVLVGLMGTWLEDARYDTGFWRDYAPWPLLVARGLLAFALGVACGALLGRVLAAVLLLGAMACVLFLPIGMAMDHWMRAEAIPIVETDLDGTVGARLFEMAWRDDATGDLISMNAYYGAPPGQSVMGADQPSGMTVVKIGVPASRYMEFALREAALTGGLAVLVGGFAFLLVMRRRPD